LRTAKKPTTATAYVERVNRAIDHVVSHLAEPLRLAELSRIAQLSAFHFHRVFQALIGVTPAELVKRLRLDKALAMMALERRASLSTIALACGFTSSSDFSRCFKQRFGVAASRFDLAAWRDAQRARLEGKAPGPVERLHLARLPRGSNPDGFQVRLRSIPARTVAYIRVDNPYRADAVGAAALRLVAWAEHHALAGGQWLGYQWDNPEVTPLEDCRYHVAVEAARFQPVGEVGRFRFPAMTVAQVHVRGAIDVELRALYWLYGSWLPRSGYVPDDQPCFEAWSGRPFAHGTERFELDVQLPVRRG
jgi:AraC family transcriptional regulator